MRRAEAVTTHCLVWLIDRTDGVGFGFTDHDCDLTVRDCLCSAGSGLVGAAIQKTTGLAVDNTEAMGALTADVIRAEDINAGRYDGASVTVIRVDLTTGAEVETVFKGEVGEIKQVDGRFYVELRGLAERLSQPLGRVYQQGCDANLGDRRCGVDTNDPAFTSAATIMTVRDQRRFEVQCADAYPNGWFDNGQIRFLDGCASGLIGTIKADRLSDGVRLIDIWFPVVPVVEQGASVQLTVGCDKRQSTCRDRFSNLLNFRGFPALPTDDWVLSYPNSREIMDGGKR
jgi:uncharacterized phage protein (TIGR02218 family)